MAPAATPLSTCSWNHTVAEIQYLDPGSSINLPLIISVVLPVVFTHVKLSGITAKYECTYTWSTIYYIQVKYQQLKVRVWIYRNPKHWATFWINYQNNMVCAMHTCYLVKRERRNQLLGEFD